MFNAVKVKKKGQLSIMNLKYVKNTFIMVIILLIIAGIYIIYIKDKKNTKELYEESREIKTTKNINIGITDYDTINPLLTKSLEMQYITKLLYEPLINITIDFNTEHGIAEEWSEIDETTYIVKIDENKKWQNGEKIKVEDIKFTMETIRNGDSIYKENIEKIERLEEIDENTFKIYLIEPVKFFEYFLCFPVVQKSTYNEELPIGSGDYKIDTLNEEVIELTGQDRKITVKIYKTITELYNNFTRENVDIMLTKNVNYEDYIGNIGFEETLIIGREFYYISCENIESIETRNIINENINKDKIIYDLYKRRYKNVKFPLEYGSYLNEENNQNKDTKSVDNIKVTLSITPDEESKKIAEIIKEDLEQTGIEVTIQNYINKNADLILKKQIVPLMPDISIYFNDEEIKQEISNIDSIENKEILKEEYAKIINKYYNELPFISLYFNTYIILHNNKIKGDFSGNWYSMFYNLDTWYKVI